MPYQSQKCCKVASLRDHHGHFIKRIKLILRGHVTAGIFKSHGVGAYHKPSNTLLSILVHPKDKTPDHKKCGIVYEIQCPECPAQYVGETARTHTVDKDEGPPKTEVSTNSCGRPWTSHQNGRGPREQYVATQEPWVHRNQDPPPGHQPRPGIWVPPPPHPPPHTTPTPTPIPHVTAVPAWPRRIRLIRLMKWPWWSRKLATLIRYLSHELPWIQLCIISPTQYFSC